MKIDLSALRRIGSGPRVEKEITIPKSTWDRISALVPTGPGKYGSTLINYLATIMLYIISPLTDKHEIGMIDYALRSCLSDNDDLLAARDRAIMVATILEEMAEDYQHRQ